MNNHVQYPKLREVLLPFCLFICILATYTTANAQKKPYSPAKQISIENPPRPINVQVSVAQHLSFGTFVQSGTLGSVTVNYSGSRSASGSVILPNTSNIVTPALFIVDAEPGTLIVITNGPDVGLTGSNGGTLNLHIEPSSTGTPFITKSQTTDVFIGGKLTVASLMTNPVGTYNGYFVVTFVQQ